MGRRKEFDVETPDWAEMDETTVQVEAAANKVEPLKPDAEQELPLKNVVDGKPVKRGGQFSCYRVTLRNVESGVERVTVIPARKPAHDVRAADVPDCQAFEELVRLVDERYYDEHARNRRLAAFGRYTDPLAINDKRPR